jgi:hypothetical protein
MRNRCFGVASGRYDAAATVTATSSNQASMAFPLLAGKLASRVGSIEGGNANCQLPTASHWHGAATTPWQRSVA